MPMRVSLSLTDIGTLLLVSYKVVAQGQGECLATCTTGPETRHQPFGRGITDRVPTRPANGRGSTLFLALLPFRLFLFRGGFTAARSSGQTGHPAHAGESAHTGQPTHPGKAAHAGEPSHTGHTAHSPHPFGQRRHLRPAALGFGVHHLLHHLTHLGKLAQDLIDLCHGRAGPGGDALPAAAVDEIRIPALFHGHGIDDGFSARHLLFRGLQIAELGGQTAKSGNKLEDIFQRPDLFHAAHLGTEILKIERGLLQLLGHNFLDIHSYCDMFLHKETSSIYAVVLQEKEPGISKVEFYKLAFPPLSKEDILPHQTGGMKPVVLISGILAGLLCLIGGSIWLLHSKRKRKVNVSVGPVATEEVKDRLVEEEPTEQKVSSVLLLGGFQVFDKQGGNITGDFTPTLKQLFLFLLLNTIKNGKGTTSQCLDETFWFDMSKSSASNNRNVNIRKLRLIIEKIGDINIANKNGYWYLNLGKDVTCDYQEVMRLLDQIKDTITDKKIINKIISLASAGALLPNVSAEWIDEYKSAYYVLLTEILLSVVNRPDIKEDSRLLLKISDVILLVDNIDEDAIRTKCRVLYQMGQKGLSKQSFDKFCIEYERLLNAKPDFSYDDIINSL